MNADIARILPEITLAAGGMALLVLPMLRSARLLGLLTLLTLAAAANLKMWAFFTLPAGQSSAFSGMLALDPFAFFIQAAMNGHTGTTCSPSARAASSTWRARRDPIPLPARPSGTSVWMKVITPGFRV